MMKQCIMSPSVKANTGSEKNSEEEEGFLTSPGLCRNERDEQTLSECAIFVKIHLLRPQGIDSSPYA